MYCKFKVMQVIFYILLGSAFGVSQSYFGVAAICFFLLNYQFDKNT